VSQKIFKRGEVQICREDGPQGQEFVLTTVRENSAAVTLADFTDLVVASLRSLLGEGCFGSLLDAIEMEIGYTNEVDMEGGGERPHDGITSIGYWDLERVRDVLQGRARV